MAEYINVELPFLEKLKELGWEIINHGANGIPQDPSISKRASFKEITLKENFKQAVKRINTVKGKPWLTDQQLEQIHAEVTALEKSHKALLECNLDVFERLVGKTKTTVAKNEITGEKDALVKLIDFENYENNDFVAINQFRVDTAHASRKAIIPDIVLFVNGLPLSVIECKDVDVADPLSESIIQIQRYANTREDDFGIKEGEEKLFHYNLFSIATHGKEARFGTITGDYEYYLNWKDIFPLEYKSFDITSFTDEQKERYSIVTDEEKPKVRQEVLISGMLNKEVILDVLKHFTLFKTSNNGFTAKIVCRYQQYRAVGKILNRLRAGKTGKERSGVVWHTQGSGKSLTMMFLIRKLRSQADLRDFKAIISVDRKDLEKQLSEDAILTGEFKSKNIVKSRKELKPKLSGNQSDLSMVMIHKFVEEEFAQSKAILRAFEKEGKVPEFKPFDEVNASDRIVLLIDEAHRTQGGEMGDNMFTAFPNAARIAFTGTPLLTERHKQKTHERFGESKEFIDTYKIREAVEDRATLEIVYEGRTSKDSIREKQEFDEEFEDMFKERTKEEKEKIQILYGSTKDYLENMDRLRKIAKDLVNHYIDNILPNGFKAMVVASSILAAARYQYLIQEAIKERLAKEEAKTERDEEQIERIKFIDACTVVTKKDNNEAGYVSAARTKAKELNAVDNFKKDFDFSKDAEGNYTKPNTGISFLCVCDKLLTGFDAPIAQVMYLDRNLREHDLLQAIARVNRTKTNKKQGLLVDYFGVAENLKTALNIWGTEDEEDIKELLEYFRDINKEIPVLEARYNRLVQLFEDKGVNKIKAFFEQKMVDKDEEFQLAETCIDLAKSIPFRAQFDTYLKAFFDSLDLLFNTKVANNYYIPAKRLGYLLIRIRNRYKDPTLDLKWAKAKVRKLIDKYLVSLGIDSKIPPVELLSDSFFDEVDKHSSSPKAKASEMEHAIRRHIKVNIDKDPALYKRFLKRMEEILKKFKDNWDMIIQEYTQIRNELEKGRNNDNEESGLTLQELPFYDLILHEAYKGNTLDTDKEQDEKEALKSLVIEVVELLQDAINKPNFWRERDAEIRKLDGELTEMLLFTEIEAVSELHTKLSVDILGLAKKRHNELTKE